jgi:hypothetical protein
MTRVTILPGEQVVFELNNNQIVLFDLNTKQIGLITRGFAPTVVIEDKI